MSTASLAMRIVADDGARIDRAARIRWAYLFLTRQVSRAEAARANAVSARTFSRWVTRLVNDGEPDTDALRAIEWGD